MLISVLGFCQLVDCTELNNTAETLESVHEVKRALAQRESREQNDSLYDIVIGEEDDGGNECPAWTLPDINKSTCSCGSSHRGTVACDPHTLNVSLQAGYCMTYDYAENTTYLARCLYGQKKTHGSYRHLPHNVYTLNSSMCGPFNRQGRVCGECKPGHSPGVFSADLDCYRCSGSYHGWGLYLLLELVPITILFLVIVFFQLRATSPSLNCFLVLSQSIVACFMFYPLQGSNPFGHANSGNSITFLLIVYGFWNLDFFRQVVPPFCITDQITGLYAIGLFYVAVLYLLMLTILAFVFIELHARNFKIFMWLWRPFHKYYVMVHRNINPHNSIIDAFATFLVLSYSRLLFTSFFLLSRLSLYTPSGKIAKYAVFFAANTDYMNSQHIPFVVIAISVLVICNLLPAMFLFLYPCKCFQKILGKLGRYYLVLHTFADAFQGCYKRGTDGERDYRYFSALYMALRGAVYITHAFLHPPADWLVPALLCFISSLCFAHFRPYRKHVFNVIDSLLLLDMAIITASEGIVVGMGVESTRPYQIIVQLGLWVPFLYITCYTFYHYVYTVLYWKFQGIMQGRDGDCNRGFLPARYSPYRILREYSMLA